MTVIFLIVSILFFLSIDWLYRHWKKNKSLSIASPILKDSSHTSFPIRIPEGIFFTKSHTWLNLYPSGKVQIGVDDLLSLALRQPHVSLLKRVGNIIKRGEPILEFTYNNNRLTIQSPIEGKILSVNDKLVHNPKLLKDAPFNDGWAYTIKPNKLADLKHFMIGSDIRQWMVDELNKLRDFVAGLGKNMQSKTLILQDGGFPMGGFLEMMDTDRWKLFEQNFLTVISHGNGVE